MGYIIVNHFIIVGRCGILNGNKENKLVKRVLFQLTHELLVSGSESIKMTQSCSALNPDRVKFQIQIVNIQYQQDDFSTQETSH